MNPLRHRSPKIENTFGNIILQSPKRKQINIINMDKKGDFINNRNNNLNNQFNYYYNKNDYNYYDEIKKAFNFITFILKQKDNQIKQLKLKINNLEKQLNDINETNVNTFSNKDLISLSSHINNIELKNKNNINTISPYNKQSKISHLMNNFLQTQTNINNRNNINNNIINISKNNNFINEKNNKRMSEKIIFDNKINIIHKIKNNTNINKINNFGNNTEIRSNNINMNNYENRINGLSNKQISLNMNINEHSNDKKNINKIRKELYHPNLNKNLIKDNNDNINSIKNVHLKKFSKESENISDTNKLKIVNFDNSIHGLGRSCSKSNSFNISDDSNMIISKNNVKNYLKEVKSKLESEKFKIFITNLKALTKNKNSEQKNEIIIQIKNLLGDKILINKFESIMKLKKN